MHFFFKSRIARANIGHGRHVLHHEARVLDDVNACERCEREVEGSAASENVSIQRCKRPSTRETGRERARSTQGKCARVRYLPP